MSAFLDSSMKRALDIVFSATVLVTLSPVLLAAAIAVKRGSPGPILFRSVRIGRHGLPFTLLKFRTMVQDAPLLSDVVTTPDDDLRITPVGRVLRRYNIDELPQFVNVLRGDMSVVGPRPEVPRYVAMFTPEEERIILSVRPGITDLASIWIGDKGKLVRGCTDPEAVYIEQIRPEKLRRQIQYVMTRSFVSDIGIIVLTFKSHVVDRIFRS